MVLKPCVPGVPRNQCGVSLKLVQGGATFTTASGETITLSDANQVVSISGTGAVTQSSQAGSILNFAAAGTSGPSTASIGGGAAVEEAEAEAQSVRSVQTGATMPGRQQRRPRARRPITHNHFQI